MLDIHVIKNDPEKIKQACINKKDPADIDRIVALSEERRSLTAEADLLKQKRNQASETINKNKRAKIDCDDLIKEMKAVSASIKESDSKIREIEISLNELMSKVPNIPHESVPHGAGEEDNVVVSEHGEKVSFSFNPKDHMEIANHLDLFDFPRGAKISGSGFPVYKGKGALLDRALLNFMLDTHIKNGYKEIAPPFLVNSTSAYGTGQLPKSQDQMYYMPEDDLYAIPTAEVPVTNLFRDETLTEAELPLQFCAYSACFRREAGSYGKDTKGFLRVHQFNKVELVKFTKPEDSYKELEKLRGNAEGILHALELPYRVLGLCDADLSFAAAKCYDLEVWAPGEEKYLEVSSCSNFESFQARRMNIKYRPKGGKPQFVHTLNGSGLATARILVAILENYQTESGTVRVPKVLQPYMHGLTEITPE